MRRFWKGYLVYLIMVASLTATLLAARHASHRLLLNFLCVDRFDARNAYLVIHPDAWRDTVEPLRPTLAEVGDHFAELTEHLPTARPAPLLYPAARVAGLMETRSILLAGLVAALVPLRWVQRRRHGGGQNKPTDPSSRMD